MASSAATTTTTQRHMHVVSGGPQQARLDRNLDTLLDDLQSSVGRGPSASASADWTVAHEDVSGDGRSRRAERIERTTYTTRTYGGVAPQAAATVSSSSGAGHDRLDSLLDGLQQARTDADDHRAQRQQHYVTRRQEIAYDTARGHRRDDEADHDDDDDDDGGHGHRLRQQHQVVQQRQETTYERQHDAIAPARQVRAASVEREVRPTANSELISSTVLAQLEPSLLPAPNTKVTTTIKTYTYEIPGAPADASLLYASNQSTPSRSFAYSSGRRSDHAAVVSDDLNRSVIVEQRHGVPDDRRPHQYQHQQQLLDETSSTTTTTTRSQRQTQHHPHQPNQHQLQHQHQHQHRQPPPPSPSHRRPYGPDSDLEVTYRYRSEHSSTDGYRGDDAHRPLLTHPAPFPTEPGETGAVGPPKRLDELMAHFPKEPTGAPYDAGYAARQTEIERQNRQQYVQQSQRQAEPTVTDGLQKKTVVTEVTTNSKNVAGPPVYYPPGHEMFAHKEESYRSGQGSAMRESGKYKYEAKSSSKSKSSSGMAVVPVCLPLCCGLPCVIL